MRSLNRNRDVHLDMAGVSFPDSRGLTVLIGLAHQLAAEHRRFVIVEPSPVVDRLLGLTGTGSYLLDAGPSIPVET